jgi:hypothetical protein
MNPVTGTTGSVGSEGSNDSSTKAKEKSYQPDETRILHSPAKLEKLASLRSPISTTFWSMLSLLNFDKRVDGNRGRQEMGHV